MAKFEGYERREAKILAALKEYGISSIDECKEICDAQGIDPYKIVEETQPICFENAKWAYVVGAAIAIKKGCKKASDAAAAHPTGDGATLAMQNAIAEASIKLSDVDYINAHGTSTPLGDLSEIIAIQKVFGDHAYNLNISSTKTMTGHLLGAAGAMEAVICVKAIENNVVPPTINHREDDVDPKIDYKMNFTFNTPQNRKVDVVLSNSFGFGGQNACLVFKRYAE